MGVFSQPLWNFSKVYNVKLPVPSFSMAQLFYEFLRRYEELKLAKRKEAIWFLGVVCLGIAALLLPWLLPQAGALSGGLLVVLYFFIRNYLTSIKEVHHLQVNVHILHHHLLGKLEVGFCDHRSGCSCAETFRSYVWKTYRISLYGGALEERF